MPTHDDSTLAIYEATDDVFVDASRLALPARLQEILELQSIETPVKFVHTFSAMPAKTPVISIRPIEPAVRFTFEDFAFLRWMTRNRLDQLQQVPGFRFVEVTMRSVEILLQDVEKTTLVPVANPEPPPAGLDPESIEGSYIVSAAVGIDLAAGFKYYAKRRSDGVRVTIVPLTTDVFGPIAYARLTSMHADTMRKLLALDGFKWLRCEESALYIHFE